MAAQKKGSEKQLSETKSAMADLLNELDQTRREYAKVSLQLTQQETLIQHLRDSEAKKDQVLAFLQDELQRVHQMHGQEVIVQGEEASTQRMELEHKLKYMELEVSRLQEENKVYSEFKSQNKTLRDTLLEHQAVIEKLQTINEDLKSTANSEMTDFRTQLEDEFKRRLADAEKRFRAEAYRALSEEAKIALQGNDHLQMVLQRQNDSIEGILGRCKQLESSHERVKTEQELAQHSLQQHQNEVSRLRRKLSESKEKNSQLEEALRQRRVERASLELLYLEYEATRKELSKAKAGSKRAQRDADRWRARAVQLSSDLGGADSLRHLDDLGQQQDKVEEQLKREQIRRSRRASRRDRVAQGARRLQEARGDVTTDGTSATSDADLSEGLSDGPHRAPRVNPMDILAMWNVNFEQWEGDPTAEAANTDSAAQATAADGASQADTAPGTVPRPYDADAEAVDESAHQPAPPRKKKMSTAQNRLENDRNLSVLSRRRPWAQPPQPQQFGSRKVRNDGDYGKARDGLTVVNAEGEFAVRKARGAVGATSRYVTP
eukprot:TRINITY_DN5501_c1_g1_i1.p1 TRINITY_DN5501_c1_g1~~TRINITY_DN5501_c1_g1_i1.p1  ORF type:complete len:549 (+),score=185.81 TRINITY_DN5501_c1_g1_i1:100-1746(+)